MPRRQRTAARSAAFALILPLLALLPAKGVEFVACFRDPAGSFLVTAVGEVHLFASTGTLNKTFVLSQSPGRPYRWTRTIRSLVLWRSEWLVADGSNRLVRFRSDGVLIGVVDVPFRVASLAIAGERIWALNMLAMTSDEQLWYSVDGNKFVPRRITSSKARFDSPLENLLLLGGGDAGELYVAPVIGPPLAHRVWPDDKPRTIALAYSRTRHRTTLEEVVGLIHDVGPYSQPARDLLVGNRGDLFVLRNREDVRSASGKNETMVARRVDRYDSTGRHLATAVLPESARWIAAVTSSQAVAVSKVGVMRTAKWGRPVPSEVWSP